MKLSQVIVALVTAVVSNAAFATTEDLQAFNVLSRTGLVAEGGMSKVHYSAEPIHCSFSNHSQEYACTLVDTSTENSGAIVNVAGPVAQELFALMDTWGAPLDSAMGKTYVSVAYVHCQQTHEGASDESEADRTVCEIDLGE